MSQLRSRHLRWLTFLALHFALLCTAGPVVAAQEDIAITVARFAGSDRAPFASPEFDDSNWRETDLPCSLGICPLPEEGSVGWYRFRFSIKEDSPLGGWALSRGRTWGAEEIYLNGERVGAVGAITERYAGVWCKTVTYSLPEEQLQQGVNVIAVRMIDTGRLYGFALDQVLVGQEGSLRARDKASSLVPELIKNGSLALGLAGFVAWFLMLVLGGMKKERLFLLTGAILGASALSFLFKLPGASDVPWFTTADNATYYALGTPAYLYFPYVLLKYPSRWPFRLLLSYGLLAAIVCLFFPLATEPGALAWMHAVLSVVFMTHSAPLLFHAHKSGHASALKVLTVWLALALSALAPNLWPVMHSYQLLALVQSGLVVFLLHVAVVSYLEHQHVVLNLQRDLLVAADEERRRLARELHDGVGQDLQAARMSLQLLARSEVGAKIEQRLRLNARTLGVSLGNIRALSRDLDPELGLTQTLGERLLFYTAELQRKTGVEVTFQTNGIERQLSRFVASHLFRSAQEAVGNVIQHGKGQAPRLELNFALTSVTISVLGGPPFTPGGSGIGWLSLNERAELLNGKLLVGSSGGVARVSLCAPMEQEG